MLPKSTGILWLDADHDDASSWSRTNHPNDDAIAIAAPISSFKSMLESDWYINSTPPPPPLNPSHQDFHSLSSHPHIPDLPFSSNPSDNHFLLHPIDSSSSCSPSQAFPLDPSHSHSLLPSYKSSCFSSLLNVVCATNFDNAFDLGGDNGLFGSYQGNQPSNSSVLMGFTGVSSLPQVANQELSLNNSEFPATRLLPVDDNPPSFGDGFNPAAAFESFDACGNALFQNRSKVLRPLEVFPQVGEQPTLFQKRAAHRVGSAGAEKLENLEVSGFRLGEDSMWTPNLERLRKMNGDEEIEDGSVDVSRLNYDSDEPIEYNNQEDNINAKDRGSNSNANSTITGGYQKGKKKGLPAKNLMAERRRRKKLNDRLYMLRSVVPKISKVRIQAFSRLDLMVDRS